MRAPLPGADREAKVLLQKRLPRRADDDPAVEESLLRNPVVAADINENEIGRGRYEREGAALQCGVKELFFGFIVRQRFGVELVIADGSHGRNLGEHRHVKGRPHPVHHAHQFRRAHPEPDTHSGQTVDLRKTADDENIFPAGGDEGHCSGEIRAVGEIGIDFIVDEKDILRQAGQKPVEGGLADRMAGGIIGIGEPDHFCARRDTRQDIVQIDGQLLHFGKHDPAAKGAHRDLVIGEGDLGDDGLVAFGEHGHGAGVNEAVAAIAEDDALGIDPDFGGNGQPCLAAARLRVGETFGRPCGDRFPGPRRHAEGIFI
jgi:hypothetical protein